MKCLCFLRFDNDRLMQGAHFRAGRVGSTASPSQSWPAKPGRGRGRGGQPFSTERHCPRVHLVAGTTCGPATPKPGALPFRHGLVLKPRGFVPLLPARRRVRPRWPLQTKPLRPRLRVRDGQLVGGCSGQAASRGSLAGSGEVSSPAKVLHTVSIHQPACPQPTQVLTRPLSPGPPQLARWAQRTHGSLSRGGNPVADD